MRQNAPFLTLLMRGRPFVTAKIALSLDGRVAAAGGRAVRLTGSAADRLTHRERAEVDAIAVGSGTVLADDPRLTARDVARHRPLARIVFDRRLRTPPGARLFSTLAAGPVIIVTTAADVEAQRARAGALEAAGGELLVVDGGVADALTGLGRLGLQSLVIEGGPCLQAAAWQAGVVDRVRIWVTPCLLGADGVQWLSSRVLSTGQLVERRAECHGADVLIEGYVHRTD
jgi:diaminohydroxyphosphoribosylaminopyrimidine deaminase/5-amino-6-(5-phosphoribosylamino)uracil reductase